MTTAPRFHRKTAKGHQEMASRSRRLGPRQRAALILVDGQRTDDEICQLLGPAAREWLIELAWQNLIEPVQAPPQQAALRALPRPGPNRPLLGYQRIADRRSQVSTTVSGFKEIEAMPSWANHSAKSG